MKRLLNKPTQNHKKRLNLKWSNQEKYFISIHHLKLKRLDDWINESRSIQFFFKITEQNNKLQLYNFPDQKPGGVSYEKVTDEIERDFDISDITATDLQDEIIVTIIITE